MPPSHLPTLRLWPRPTCQTEIPGAGSQYKHRAGTLKFPGAGPQILSALSAFVQPSGLGTQTWPGSASPKQGRSQSWASRARPYCARNIRPLSQACNPHQDLILETRAPWDGVRLPSIFSPFSCGETSRAWAHPPTYSSMPLLFILHEDTQDGASRARVALARLTRSTFSGASSCPGGCHCSTLCSLVPIPASSVPSLG